VGGAIMGWRNVNFVFNDAERGVPAYGYSREAGLIVTRLGLPPGGVLFRPDLYSYS
jgi:hypothetical protein